jgi:hypothetical protein
MPLADNQWPIADLLRKSEPMLGAFDMEQFDFLGLSEDSITAVEEE